MKPQEAHFACPNRRACSQANNEQPDDTIVRPHFAWHANYMYIGHFILWSSTEKTFGHVFIQRLLGKPVHALRDKSEVNLIITLRELMSARLLSVMSL